MMERDRRTQEEPHTVNDEQAQAPTEQEAAAGGANAAE